MITPKSPQYSYSSRSILHGLRATDKVDRQADQRSVTVVARARYASLLICRPAGGRRLSGYEQGTFIFCWINRGVYESCPLALEFGTVPLGHAGFITSTVHQEVL